MCSHLATTPYESLKAAKAAVPTSAAAAASSSGFGYPAQKLVSAKHPFLGGGPGRRLTPRADRNDEIETYEE